MVMEEEIAIMWSHGEERQGTPRNTEERRGTPRNAGSHQKLEAAKNGFSPRAPGGNIDFELLASRTKRE